MERISAGTKRAWRWSSQQRLSTTPIRRCTSEKLVARPTEARTAPTATSGP